jgi:hypothetical protein
MARMDRYLAPSLNGIGALPAAELGALLPFVVATGTRGVAARRLVEAARSRDDFETAC